MRKPRGCAFCFKLACARRSVCKHRRDSTGRAARNKARTEGGRGDWVSRRCILTQGRLEQASFKCEMHAVSLLLPKVAQLVLNDRTSPNAKLQETNQCPQL